VGHVREEQGGDVAATVDVVLDTQRLPLALPDKPSIAVLAFTNMSGDPDQEYFAEGIAEEITMALARLRGFFVISRNSAFTYKGKPVNVQQVGRELGVQYVLEGSVRKSWRPPPRRRSARKCYDRARDLVGALRTGPDPYIQAAGRNHGQYSECCRTTTLRGRA